MPLARFIPLNKQVPRLVTPVKEWIRSKTFTKPNTYMNWCGTSKLQIPCKFKLVWVSDPNPSTLNTDHCHLPATANSSLFFNHNRHHRDWVCSAGKPSAKPNCLASHYKQILLRPTLLFQPSSMPTLYYGWRNALLAGVSRKLQSCWRL